MTRSRSITFLASGTGLLLAALAVAGCGSSSPSSAPAAPTSGRTVNVANTGLGQVLVNSQGRTLYLFGKDSGSTSACNGACATNWPPLGAKGKPTLGSGANTSLVGTIKRSDGTTQVTYNGHPLYLFKGDQKAGDTNGEGLNAFGGTWNALSSSGDQVVSNQASNPGGGGY
jgi:predicted lipoprotein with Yx(FWY)xxD motif